MWLSSFLSTTHTYRVCWSDTIITAFISWSSNSFSLDWLITHLSNYLCSTNVCLCNKLKFLTGCACERGKIIGANESWGLETDAKERVCELCVNFAILNRIIIIIIFLVHKHFIAIWNLLYVVWISLFMLKICHRNISIALITCFDGTG